MWPASPDKPATAFTFYLMDLMETVFLHCKVSLREFCEAVELLRPSLQPRMVRAVNALPNYPVVFHVDETFHHVHYDPTNTCMLYIILFTP